MTPDAAVRSDDVPRFVLVAGGTRTATIEGISAAGANPDLVWHTPAADAELLHYGTTIRAPGVPVSPTGCPTPALVTRAAREELGFDCTILDAGLAAPTAAPTHSLDAMPGGDVRAATPVPGARALFEAAREFGTGLPDRHLLLGESIPGGTTTALGVLRALGEPYGVSSSLPENPTSLKGAVVTEGLEASDRDEGEHAGAPLDAIREMGDPVLAALAGVARGALETGTHVTLAGGTQMIAVAALLRHAGVEADLSIATTSYVAADDSADFREAAADLDLDIVVTDPGFGALADSPLARYLAGEAKEGVGMGGVLALADGAGNLAAVRERTVELYDALLDDPRAADGSEGERGP